MPTPRTHAERIADLARSVDAMTPRPAQGGVAARAAIVRAQTLAGKVRDEGPDTIGAYLDPLDRDQFYALTVALAAMVPLDTPVEELLGWLEPLGARLEAEAQAAARRSRQDTAA